MFPSTLVPFWSYWLAEHKATFDGVSRLIHIAPSVTYINVEQDLYSDWKEWVTFDDNSKYLQALRAVGGDPLPGGDFLGNTFFLTNGWRIVLDHGVNFEGNLYTDEGDSPFIVEAGIQLSTSTVSNLVLKVAPDHIDVPSANDVAAQVWNALLTNHLLAGSFGQFVQTLPATTAALVPTPPSAATIANAVWDEPSMDHVSAGSTGEMLSQIKADTGSVSISNAALTTLVNTLLKYEKNRTKIDTVNKQMIIYDDDCTTVLHRFNLRDANGQPSVQEVCERVPTTCP